MLWLKSEIKQAYCCIFLLKDHLPSTNNSMIRHPQSCYQRSGDTVILVDAHSSAALCTLSRRLAAEHVLHACGDVEGNETVMMW